MRFFIVTLQDALGVWYETLMNTRAEDRLRLLGLMNPSGVVKGAAMTNADVVLYLPIADVVVTDLVLL